jgi:hypothetical protein
LEDDLNIVLDRLIADHISPHQSELRSVRHKERVSKDGRVSFNPQVQQYFFDSTSPIKPLRSARHLTRDNRPQIGNSEHKSKVFKEFAQSCLTPIPRAVRASLFSEEDKVELRVQTQNDVSLSNISHTSPLE